MLNIKYLRIAPEIEGVDCLYIEDELYMHGDEYHDCIDARINGFLEGLQYAGIEYEFESWAVSHTEPVAGALGANPAKRFSSISPEILKLYED